MPMPQPPALPVRPSDETPHGARIKVVGVGGGGNNAIDRMIASGMEGVEFVAFNTDIQALQVSKAEVRQQIGARLTHGLGAGSDPDIGRRAALQDSEVILEALDGADMVFVTAGLGGGTGTGAAPVIAALASDMGALTVAIVTRPFGFEGKRRMAIADWGIHHLLNYVDTLIVIPNEKLLAVARDAPFFESFRIADDFLRQAVQGISDIITTAGVINRDFADVKTTMAGMGYGVMGTASRSGPNRAIDAVMGAMASPLLEAGAIDGARGILINVTGSSSLRLSEVNAASTVIQGVAHEDANIIFGAVLDERLGDEVKVTVIATGFREEGRNRAERRVRMLREPGSTPIPENVDGPTAQDQVEEAPIPIAQIDAGSSIAVAAPALLPVEVHDVAAEVAETIPEPPLRQRVDDDLGAGESPDLALAPNGSPEASELHETRPVHEEVPVVIEEAASEDLPRTATSSEIVESTGNAVEQRAPVFVVADVDAADIDEDESADGGSHEQEFETVEGTAALEDEPVYVERQIVPASSLELTLTDSPAIQRETVRLTHFRRAAMAAYAAAASPEEEPGPSPRAAASSGFAQVLEARRRFVETTGPQEPEVKAEPDLSAEEERAIEVLMEAMAHHEAWEQTEDESQEQFADFAPIEAEEMLPIIANNAATIDQDYKMLIEPPSEEPASDAELSLSAPAESQQRDFFPLRQTYESEDGPRPLPDFKRRLHRDVSEDQGWQTADSDLEAQLLIPAFASGPETEGSSDEFDELDIPAFLRRGRG